jgi:hypothetical protein
VVSAAHPGSWQESSRLALMSNLTERAASERHARPQHQGRPPQFAGQKGAHHGLSSSIMRWPWVQTPACDATVNKLCSCTRTAGKVLVELPELAQRCQQLPRRVWCPGRRRRPPTAPRDTGCMRGCGEGCLDGVTALAVGAGLCC